VKSVDVLLNGPTSRGWIGFREGLENPKFSNPATKKKLVVPLTLEVPKFQMCHVERFNVLVIGWHMAN
jgi:hypothetical protein